MVWKFGLLTVLTRNLPKPIVASITHVLSLSSQDVTKKPTDSDIRRALLRTAAILEGTEEDSDAQVHSGDEPDEEPMMQKQADQMKRSKPSQQKTMVLSPIVKMLRRSALSATHCPSVLIPHHQAAHPVRLPSPPERKKRSHRALMRRMSDERRLQTTLARRRQTHQPPRRKAQETERTLRQSVEVFSKLLLMWLFHCDNQKIVGLINIEMFQTIVIKVFHCNDLKKGSKAQS